jgi:signal transduction histidine kinase
MPATAALSTSGRYTSAGILALTMAVFAGAVFAITWQMRADAREQILRREAGTLAAVASMQLDLSAVEYGEVVLAEVPGALLVAVLKTSKLRGVVGVRVFDPKGTLNSSDGIVGAMEPPERGDWARVAGGEAFARWHAGRVREDWFVLPAGIAPHGLVEAWVPLRRTGARELIGAAQFWLEGGAASAEIGAHHRRLWAQAAIAWGAGSLVIGCALGWALRRLAAAHTELRNRSDDLERANRELVLAAKTSALGTVAAHLMHELKRPLAGLELFVAGQAEANAGNGAQAGAELAAATELTRRLQTMVNDVVGVLRDEQTGAAFQMSGAEVAELAVGKVRAEGDRRGVRLIAEGGGEFQLSGRRANLATLVLRNVLQNALEASGQSGEVRVTASALAGGEVEFVVADRGPGLSDAVRARLFQPCASGKPGGSGLGLALSHHLAQQAGGRLELVRSTPEGTSFRLVLRAEA